MLLNTRIFKDKPLYNGKFFESISLVKALERLDINSRNALIEYRNRSSVDKGIDGSLDLDLIEGEYNDNKLCAKIKNYHFSETNELIFDIDVINELVINDFLFDDSQTIEFGIRSISRILDDEWKDYLNSYEQSKYLLHFIDKYGNVYMIDDIVRFVIVYEDK